MVMPHVRFLAVLRVLSVTWVLIGGIGLGGCRTHPLPLDSSLPGVTFFDRALMAYAQGELDVSFTELSKQRKVSPGDLRVQALVEAIEREQGKNENFPVKEIDQNSSPRPLSATQLLRRTQERNPEIRQRIQDIIRARARWREARLSFTPEFFALTRFYPGGFFVRLTQDILGGLFERPLRMNQAEAGILEALARYAQTNREVQSRMVHAYFMLLESQKTVHFLQLAIAVAEEQHRVGRALADEGLMAEGMVLSLKEELLDLQQQLQVRQSQVVIAQATIKGLLDVPNSSTVHVQGQYLSPPQGSDVDQSIAKATQDRPELHAVEAQLQQRQLGQDANLWMLPTMNVRTTYGETSDEGKGDFLDGLSLGVSGEMPLLLWPLREAQSDREHAFIHRLELEWARIKAEIMIETVEAHERLRVVQVGFFRQKKQTLAREAAWKALEQRIQAGANERPFDVMTAHREYLESQQEEVIRQYEQQRAVFDLQMVSGAPFDTLNFLDREEAGMASVGLTQSQPVKRGLWVWQTENVLSVDERVFFLSFLFARDIKAVFLFVSPEIFHEQSEALQDFLREAHQKGLEVHALNGEPTWIFQDQRNLAQAFLAAVTKYHAQVSPEERFDAFHLDVEPHALPAWNTDGRTHVVRHFVEFLDWVAAQVALTHLPMVVDIPYWYDKVSIEEEGLLQHVWHVADQVAIMAYRNSPAKVFESIQQELELFQAHPQPVWVGVSAESPFWPQADIHQSVEMKFEAMVQEIGARLTVFGSNVGVSIQDYAHYQDMILSAPIQNQSFSRRDRAKSLGQDAVRPSIMVPTGL